MTEQVQKTKTKVEKEAEVVDVPTQDKGAALKAEMDELLEEIDDVLETNAEDFVKQYIQKGGE
jgi:ubiquitin-like protein Pup